MYYYCSKNNSNKVLLTNEAVKDQNAEIVMYYHPHCGHCTTFKPIFKEFKADRSHVKMIDCSKEQCEGIDAFPTVLGFKNGNRVEYQGNRTIESLVKFENSL